MLASLVGDLYDFIKIWNTHLSIKNTLINQY